MNHQDAHSTWVIKIGTHALLSALPTTSTIFCQFIEQLIQLHRMGHRVILVSSGAIGLGRQLAEQQLNRPHTHGLSIQEKQLLSTLGQPLLMQTYAQALKPHHYVPAQLLLSRRDFDDACAWSRIRNALDFVCRSPFVLPVVNENDVIAMDASDVQSSALFIDNDELAAGIAERVQAERLVILTHVAGVYHQDQMHTGPIIPVIDSIETRPIVSEECSTYGRGGMWNKLCVAYQLAAQNMITHIAPISDCLIERLTTHRTGTTVMPHHP